jgi:hypothetical protein
VSCLEGDIWNVSWVTDIRLGCVEGQERNLHWITDIREGSVVGEVWNINWIKIKERIVKRKRVEI